MKNLLKTVAALGAVILPAFASADTVVFVHGAFQTGESWSTVAEKIAAEGHEVVVVDLPGRDAVGEAAKAVTLADYIEPVTQAVKAASDPVTLVGHSFGGMTISAVAEADPDLIDRLIYVAAYLPQSGESMEKLALSDGDNQFTAETFVIAGDYSHAEILAADQVRVFAQDATPEQAAALTASMVREPLGPIGTAIELSDEKFGSVEKAYIRTLEDGTVSTPLQRMMIERAGVADVRDIATGHAPHLTDPDGLAALILDLME